VLDIVFVLDSSGSIRDQNPPDNSFDNWNLMLEFTNEIINDLQIGFDYTRVGVVRFADTARSFFYLNTYLDAESVRIAISDIGYRGSDTNTAAGLMEMMNEQFRQDRGDRPEVQNIAIVITDGVSTINPLSTVPTAIQARDRGIKIFTIGITNSINEEELRLMSSPPQIKNENWFTTPSFQAYQEVSRAIQSEICNIEGSGERGGTWLAWLAWLSLTMLLTLYRLFLLPLSFLLFPVSVPVVLVPCCP
jgi:hypothetical protein